MKKRVCVLLCVFLLLAACVRQEATPPEGAYKVYFAVAGQAGGAKAVDFEYRTLNDGEDPIRGLVRILLAGPASDRLASPFLEGVRLRSARLEKDGRLRLDLSEQYNGLPGVYLTVANACLLLTLTQVEGVESLHITVEGTTLPYQTIQPLTPDHFLLSNP